MAAKSQKKGQYTKYSNKIGLYSNVKGNFIKNDTDVVLHFPFKDAVLEAGMSKEDVGREERFLQVDIDSKDIDTLEEPKVLTDFRYIDKNGEKTLTADSDIEFFDENDDLKQNMLIKGNNLLALYTLREKLAGKVKLIYIDPPYNTKGDADTFTYNNNFNHSAWLTFMKNRLEVAKELVTQDGFIAIAIDHVELFYLGVLADEIFGAHNRVGIVTVVHNPKGRNQAKFFSANSEFMLVYARDIENANFNKVALTEAQAKSFTERDEKGTFRYEPYIRSRTAWSRKNRPNNWYPLYVSSDLKTISSNKFDNAKYELFPVPSTGKEMSWKNIKETFDELNKDGYFIAKREGNTVVIYHKYYEQSVLKNVWDDKRYQSEFNGTKLLKSLVPDTKFSYPKSLYTVLDTIRIMTKPEDVVIDFFGGSLTTAHAVLEANIMDNGSRKFVMVEQLEEHVDVGIKRLKKIVDKNDASFVYLELKKYNQEYIERINAADSLKELEEIYVEIRNNAFLKFWFTQGDFEKDTDFRNLDLSARKQVLISVLDENQLYLNYADMNDTRHEVTNTEKTLTDRFYDTH
ncbi:MAG: site-specific DNA-methyltransferase [Micrococcaceae bacterium]